MPIINFRCKKCKVYFDFDVGKISFKLVDERPVFEKKIRCERCGELSMDEVELTETGQSQLTELYLKAEK